MRSATRRRAAAGLALAAGWLVAGSAAQSRLPRGSRSGAQAAARVLDQRVRGQRAQCAFDDARARRHALRRHPHRPATSTP